MMLLKTYQDLTAIGQNEQQRMNFILAAINEHKNSEIYQIAKCADEYFRHQNRTILEHEATLVTVSGRFVKDEWAANHKTISNFFFRFVEQENQYLLGNGVRWTGATAEVPEGTHGAVRDWVWDNAPTVDGDNSNVSGHYVWKATINTGVSEKLGADFDNRLDDWGENALVHGVAFAFYNKDHIEIFKLLEFVPLYDEENGALKAGIRFWQVDDAKPLRATLYELDGYTEYYRPKNEEMRVIAPKRAYIEVERGAAVDDTMIYEGKNYDGFPIIPMWANKQKQSEFVGLRDGIDAYDMIKNGYENDLDNAQIYWIVKGAGGMDNRELAQFLDRLKVNKIANVDGDQDVQPVPVHIPYVERETLLQRISQDLYRDFLALDLDGVISGANTATQIKAAYSPLDLKVDLFEYCVRDAITALLKIVGIQDKPMFDRNQTINKSEEISNLIQIAQFVDEEYVTRKALAILGDTDQAEEILRRKEVADMQRMIGMGMQIPEGEENAGQQGELEEALAGAV